MRSWNRGSPEGSAILNDRHGATTPVVLEGGYYDVFRKKALQAELASIQSHSDVVLDLSRTEQIDCACLGLFVARLREWRAQKPGTNLRLVNVSPRIARILSLLSLDTLFIVNQPSP